MTEFDFTVTAQYGEESFKNALVNGPGELREVVWGSMATPGSPFMSVLMGLSADGDITSSQWVGGGSLEPPGVVKIELAKLFPAVSKNLLFSINVDLATFEWPRDGSFLSGYREVPRDIPITVWKKTEMGDLVIDWESAKEEGCVEFAVRAMVVHCSATEVLVQLGSVPFDIGHMLSTYPQVYQEAFFPEHSVEGGELGYETASRHELSDHKVGKKSLTKGGGCGGIWPWDSPFLHCNQSSP